MKRHLVEVIVDGRRQASLYAKDFYVVADQDELELHASTTPIPTHGKKVKK